MFPLTAVNSTVELDGFHNVYYFEFGKYHHHAPERHSYWEMVYVDKGRVLANTGGNICTLEEGQAIFHGPGEVHAHVSNKEVANNLLVVSFSCTSKNAQFFSGKVFTLDKTEKMLLSLFTNEAENALGHITGDFYDEKSLDFSDEKFGASQLMKCHFSELMIKLYRRCACTDNDGKRTAYKLHGTDETLDAVIEYLEKHIYTNITLADICNTFYVRKSRLSGIFKEYTGKSPMSYFKWLKIEQAKKMLREENLSVSQITDILGYSGIHNFTRAFKGSTGFSPTGYKKSVMLLQNSDGNRKDS